MARTRTSLDKTYRPRHSKPLIYACLYAAVLPLAAAGIGLPAVALKADGGQGIAPAGVPCIECQVLSVTPGQVQALPSKLDGVRVALRVDAQASVPAEQLAELRRRGARLALHVRGVPASPSPLLATDTELVVFEP